MLETGQELLDKQADTATATEPDVRWCGERDAHRAHQWPELVAGVLLTRHCQGTTEEGAKRMRFRNAYGEHWGPVTRDDAERWDGGVSTYRFDDEGPDGEWRNR